MPGLIAVAGARSPDDTRIRHARAQDRMLRHGGMRAETWSGGDGVCLVSHIALARQPDAAGPLRSPATSGVSIVFHGVLHNERELQRAIGATGTNRAGILAALYARDGAAFVSRLKGEFCLAVVDNVRQRLMLATDQVGSYPIYWASNADGLVAASELGALLRATSTTARLDLRAVADYLTVGRRVRRQDIGERRALAAARHHASLRASGSNGFRSRLTRVSLRSSNRSPRTGRPICNASKPHSRRRSHEPASRPTRSGFPSQAGSTAVPCWR